MNDGRRSVSSRTTEAASCFETKAESSRFAEAIFLAAVLAGGCGDYPQQTARGASGGKGGSAGSGGAGNAPSTGGASGSGALPGSGGSGSGAGGGSGGTGGSSGGGSDAASDASGGASGNCSSASFSPADLLDLENWMVTLPIGDTGDPTEIQQPELSTFSIDPYFHVDAACDRVVFQAHAGGVTTTNSSYPRSELREMTSGGTEKAAWSTTSGRHTMTITQAITHLPAAKPEVVAGQLHDASDDVVMVRLEGDYLFVEGAGADLGSLDESYALGTWFTVKLEASGGRIRVYYEDMTTPKVDVSRSAADCYFKAGVYTQSNTGTGDEPTAYGEVMIRELLVTHE